MSSTGTHEPPGVTLPAWLAGPETVRGLSQDALAGLAERIRQFLIDKVCSTGGHLGPNLGVIELTLALHRVFDSPRDVLLFDTGHQAYVHKILTGRQDDFDTLRQSGGLSGYPSRAESGHDVIENSHASTSLSYADGLAKAFAVRQEHDRRVVAIVGDGALTGGMCWEALNNIGGAPDRPVIIVLNDNGRSYSPTVGGVSAHLGELAGLAGSPRTHLRSYTYDTDRSLFESLGLSYLGPFDGHDTLAMERALRRAAALRHPVVVHMVTTKGRGYQPAEDDEEDCLHTVSVVDPQTGRPRSASKPTWTSVFGHEIGEIGAERDDVVCITAAMPHPTGLTTFAARFPDRVFDVGIAEQHAVTSAAGLATGGLHPVVALYSTFLSRAFDQVLMDVALHRLPVTFVLDRAGVTGPDGPSHHGMWDSSILPVVPGLRLAAPRDPSRLRELLREAIDVTDGPTVLRYPKATAGADIAAVYRVGECDILRESTEGEVMLVAVGPLAEPCLSAADELAGDGVPVTVVDPRWIAPVSPDLVSLARDHRLVLAVEDTTATGALGARLGQALTASGSSTRAATFALPPRFLPHASRNQILQAHGLDAAGIATTVLKRLGREWQTTIEPTEEVPT
ncbi:1-deoxy-D-xylulose-5-phosphate synthase [Actinobacteria bacterium YIM 96077]|uniref:1-deoxy-D-xylulose-5-phosphate synthase n=1 Tax=Phytoactinopolyspora halophila TaxID=1981511 RepID=A0A329QUE6_9ACTN|nr:1-deoxy-D-xylulose-5-phosphate synthase [Actinobacteria bacterium YIM 96077]RAW15646.1 1-deoxy-D-xylulose-5-phosphate synthase [Phytoactinopolyspora halophila]